MTVYNGEAYVRAAVDSILAQSFTDFELLVIDDGSTDQSVAVVESYRDPRIILHRNLRNIGQTPSLNVGIRMARGKYLARLDCDDISLPERLKKQVTFMEQHPEVGVCGTGIKFMFQTSPPSFLREKLLSLVANLFFIHFPVTDQEMQATLLFKPPFYHPTVMIRLDVLKKHGIYYNETFRYCQDFDLWSRLAAVTAFANIPEPLLLYRIHAQQMTQAYSVDMKITENLKVQAFMLNKLGIFPTSHEGYLHLSSVFADKRYLPESHLDDLEVWLKSLLQQNTSVGSYDQLVLRRVVEHFWLVACENNAANGLSIFWKYMLSELKMATGIPLNRLIRFLCMIFSRLRKTDVLH